MFAEEAVVMGAVYGDARRGEGRNGRFEQKIYTKFTRYGISP